METFASGPKTHYYGKGDVIVYRLNRDGRVPEGASPVFGANVLMLVYGDAFWPTYTTGDNSVAHRHRLDEELHPARDAAFAGHGLEDYCRFLGAKFLATYPQVEGVQVSATEIPYAKAWPGGRGVHAGGPGTGARAHRAESRRRRRGDVRASGASGCCGSAAARSTDSCATSTRRCPTSPIGPCTCGSTSNGATRARRRRSPTARVARAGAPDRRGRLQIVRVRQHPAGDLPDGDEAARRAFRRSPKCTSKPTTARGTRWPSAATSSASTPMRGRRTAVWASR